MRGIGGSEYHTSSILSAIVDNERRMLSTLDLPNVPMGDREEYILAIQNEDDKAENIFDGITPDDLTNGGQVQDASRALARQRRTSIQASLHASRLLRMGFHSGRLQVLLVQ